MFIAFAILLLIVILFVLLSFKGGTKRRLERLEHEIMTLKKLLSQQIAVPAATTEKKADETKPDIFKPEKKEDYWKSGFKITEKKPAPLNPLHEWREEPEQTAFNLETTTLQKEETAPAALPVFPLQPPPVSKPQKPSFFERNPDLEKFIGENLVSKIGIGILVLAIAYFVKFAIDNEWIGAIGRVAIGIVCGGILISIAHRLRSNYHAFSSVLAGGGLAVLYFTITLAFQQYQLFSQTVAFIIMLVITAFAVALALLYNREELAVIALTGGFAAPFLISTGSGNYITLFTYLIVLNTGLLLIAYNKAWRIVNTTAFVFTVILFASWLYALPYNEKPSTYTNGFLFAAIFYLLFLVINIANNIRENKRFIAFDFSVLLADAALFFSAGLYCLHNSHSDQYNGLFSAAMAVFNLVFSYFLFAKKSLDTNILYLLIGITLTFVSLTAPLQLHGHFITLFWASEAVLLGWLYIKSKISIIQYAALIVYVCMFVSLLGDWANIYGIFSVFTRYKTSVPVVLNRGFITGCYAAAASYVLHILLRKSNSRLLFVNASFFRIAALVILFLVGNIEINYQFNHHFSFAGIAILYQELYSFSFVLILFYINKKINHSTGNSRLQTIWLVSCVIAYFLLLASTTNLLHTLLYGRNQSFNYLFIAHWLTAVLTGVIFYRLIRLISDSAVAQKNKLAWLISLGVVAFFSAEVYLITLQLFYTNETQEEIINRVFVKAVLPVLWGLCSFALMWLGMRYKFKTLRVISLSLFSFTLLKLFAYDISNIPVAGKIIAFFCLGILLLIISFMYQRLKKIIIEDEAKPLA